MYRANESFVNAVFASDVLYLCVNTHVISKIEFLIF